MMSDVKKLTLTPLLLYSCYQSETEESPADADSRKGRQEATAGRWAGRHVPP